MHPLPMMPGFISFSQRLAFDISPYLGLTNLSDKSLQVVGSIVRSEFRLTSHKVEDTQQLNTTNSNNVLKAAIINCLSGIPIFADLNPVELNTLGDHVHVSRFEPGDIVFSEGDPGDEVCFVVDGILDVLKMHDGREEKKIAIKAPGGSIGEMAVIGDFSRTATVKACTDATLLTLSRRRFDQICDDHPAIGVKILRAIARILSRHLKDTSQELLELIKPKNHLSASGR